MKRLLLAILALSTTTLAAADQYRMVVRIKDGSGVADAQDAAASMGGTLIDTTPNAPFALISLHDDPLTLTLAQLQIMAGVVDVLWAGDDAVLWSAESVATGSTVGVIATGSTVGVIGTHDDLVQMNANFLAQVGWSPSLANSDGRTVHIAILDNGLSHQQTGLWAKVDASFDAFGGTADDIPMGRDSNHDGHPDGGVGHGTMVAGIVDTVAPKVRFVIAKVADSDGRASAWAIVKGLAFAANQGCEIANVSLGSEDEVPAFASAAQWAQTKGMLVVAASGNAGVNHAWYPSRDPSSLCVTGLNPDDTKASFSNYDPVAVAAAPAVGLINRWWDGGIVSWSGTSFASPFVAAALADCLRRTTPKTPSLLTQAVRESGRPIDSINDAANQGKLGTVLDISALNQKIQGGP